MNARFAIRASPVGGARLLRIGGDDVYELFDGYRVASVEIGSDAMKSPSQSRGDGGWGFHLRDGHATKHLRYASSRLRSVCATR
jgi:hypothetical protein